MSATATATMRAIQLVEWSSRRRCAKSPSSSPARARYCSRVPRRGPVSLRPAPDGLAGRARCPYDAAVHARPRGGRHVAALGDGADRRRRRRRPCSSTAPGDAAAARPAAAARSTCASVAARAARGCGLGRDGGLADDVVDPVPAPDWCRSATSIRSRAAPLADAGLTPYHAIKRALRALRPGADASWSSASVASATSPSSCCTP